VKGGGCRYVWGGVGYMDVVCEYRRTYSSAFRVYAYTCVCVYMCVWVYVCIYAYIYVCIGMYVCMYACVYVYMYMYMYVCVCVCVHVYIYIGGQYFYKSIRTHGYVCIRKKYRTPRDRLKRIHL